MNGLLKDDDTQALPRLGTFQKGEDNVFYLEEESVKKAPTQVDKQSSFITIFSTWNLTLGTSLLSVPWALEKGGLILGPILLVVVNLSLLYSCYLIIESVKHCENKEVIKDFNDVIRCILGKAGEIISTIIVLFVLTGVCLIYWILASNFLYTTVAFLRASQSSASLDRITKDYTGNSSDSLIINTGLLCPINDTALGINRTQSADDVLFDRYWNRRLTVPLYLLVILFPLVNFRSPVIFNKMSSIGTISSVYIVIFVIVKSSFWENAYETKFEYALPTFPVVTGAMSSAFAVHANLLPITQSNRNPKNNVRDVSIAYGCSCVTYLFVGLLFLIKFPISKSCIQAVFLNNFEPDDIMSFVARLMLLVQNIVTYPTILFCTRIKLMIILFGSDYPSWRHVLIFNGLVVTICILGAIFFPDIGSILRYVGAFGSGFYALVLPCVVQFAIRKRENRLTVGSVVSYIYIVTFAISNCIAQVTVN